MNTEIIEDVIEDKGIEGEVHESSQAVRNFLSLSAAQDFCLVFKIDNYNCRTGYLPDGKRVVQITYTKEDK